MFLWHHRQAMRSRRASLTLALLFLAFQLFTLYLRPLSATTKKPPLQPVNLNTATAPELQQVPGIGPSTADKILKMRKAYGPFKSVDDLRAIKGIGPKRLARMRKYLTVGKPAVAKKPALPQPSAGAHSPSKNPSR